MLGLLETDLLRALALYALVGACCAGWRWLTPFEAWLHAAGGARGAGRRADRRPASAGALLAPMNGSVGASVSALAPSEEPPPVEAPRRRAGRAGRTLGVVVPPSLVLLLLGDAMMRAHTGRD